MPRLLVLFAGCLVVSACVDSDGDTFAADNVCDTLSLCSIQDEACQRAVLDLTACVRGDVTPPLPTIRLMSREELLEELTADAADDAAEAAADAEGAAASLSFERALAALHLVTDESSLSEASVTEQANGLAAFYREDHQDVTIITDTTMEPLEALNTLSHEYVHYLQDRAGQLEGVREGRRSSDESIALRSLIEGEALVTSYRTNAAMVGRSSRDVFWTAMWDALEMGLQDATDASSSPLLTAILQLPYLLGSPSVQIAWEGGRSEVDALFEDTPSTGLDWLLNPGQTLPTLATDLDCYPVAPPRGYSLVGVDSFGIAGLYALLGAQQQATLLAARDWRQDRLAVYAEDNSRGLPNVLALWRLHFVDPKSAVAFAFAIAPLRLDVTQRGQELTIRASVGSDDALSALDPNECPSEEDFVRSLPMRERTMAKLRLPLRQPRSAATFSARE
jgi:hypothetical protein